MLSILLIIIAWVVKMPLWLSITTTVCCSLNLFGNFTIKLNN